MGPVLVPGLECLLDEQSLKAGAVDEQFTCQFSATVELERVDVSGLRMQAGTKHAPFDVFDAAVIDQLFRYRATNVASKCSA